MLKYEFGEVCYSETEGKGVIVGVEGNLVSVVFKSNRNRAIITHKCNIQEKENLTLYHIIVEKSLELSGVYKARFSDIRKTSYVGASPSEALNNLMKHCYTSGGDRNV